MMSIKHLVRCLAHSRYSVGVHSMPPSRPQVLALAFFVSKPLFNHGPGSLLSPGPKERPKTRASGGATSGRQGRKGPETLATHLRDSPPQLPFWELHPGLLAPYPLTSRAFLSHLYKESRQAVVLVRAIKYSNGKGKIYYIDVLGRAPRDHEL